MKIISRRLTGLLLMSLFITAGHSSQAVSQEMRVGEIEDKDVNRIQKRQQALDLKGFGLGTARSVNSNHAALTSLQYLSTSEATLDQEIRFGGKVMVSDDGQHGFVGGSMGVAHHFSRGSLSPFVGAGFGLAMAKGEESEGSQGGFNLEIYAGMRAFRTSNSQMELNVGCEQLQNRNKLDKKPTFCGIRVNALFQN